MNVAPTPIVLGYAPDWTPETAPDRIVWPSYTHLCPAFASIAPDGAVTPSRGFGALCWRAKHENVGVLASIGGADSNKAFTTAMSTPAGARKLRDSLLALLDAPGCTGLDIDWEAHTSAADRDRLVALCASLRPRMGPVGRGQELTLAVPGSDWGGKWFDTKALLPLADRLHLMAYDFHGPWGKTAGHNANLNAYTGDDGQSVAGSIDYWQKTRAWPASRLVLGLPLYGRGFKAASWGAQITGKSSHEYTSWRDVVALQKAGWKMENDAVAGAVSVVSPDNTERLSVDNPALATQKGELAKKRGLGGIFFWEISHDTGGGDSLVTAARRGLLNPR